MKSLYLVRHAKSSHDIPYLEDVLRGLADRGKSDATLVGKYLKSSQAEITRVFSSHSVRTKATMAIINKELGIPESAITYHESLYTFDDNGDTFMDYARQTYDSNASIMILSHNYSCIQFADRISDGEIDRYPTCGVLRCVWNLDSWEEITIENVTHYQMITPKMLKTQSI